MWTELHASLLSKVFQKLLGRPDAGAMAFVRCLSPEVVADLAGDTRFRPEGWRVARVADESDTDTRTITADHAVELRETKGEALLLLVDTGNAGAGMDGIYSAAREIEEATLFKEALRRAAREITNRLGRGMRDFSERAVKRARGHGQQSSISPWAEFDFYVQVAHAQRHPGSLLWLLGLWPIEQQEEASPSDGLDISRLFVDRLLGAAGVGQTPSQRIEGLRLLNPSEEQRVDLERFLRRAATQPLLTSLADLADKEHLWVNALRLEGEARAIQKLELVSWRSRQGKLAKWPGLLDQSDEDPPVLILDPKAEANGNYSQLEVRWKARPDNLERNAVQYQVAIVTDMGGEIASREVSHSARKEEKCRFTNDDFSQLSEDTLLNARVFVSVIGNEDLEPLESEEFQIRFGTPQERTTCSSGKSMRAFCEGVIELDEREQASALATSTEPLSVDGKGNVLLRTPQRGKSFRVFRPPLLHEVEQDWISRNGEIGRWRVKVRASGVRASAPEFVTLGEASVSSPSFDRAAHAGRRLAERFAVSGGGVGQIYDQKTKFFDMVVKDYLLAWGAVLDEAPPELALANTVEIQSLSGRTIGLIVLPSHPLRVAWHVAYDNLVLHTRYEGGASPKKIRDEFKLLDGSMFPAFLPGIAPNSTFVFADMLGFHVVGMVLEEDREPKAAIALLARALGESETADSAPAVGGRSAQVLGNEILKYIECHETSKLLHIHALRPGDGLTVVRSLGFVQKQRRRSIDGDDSAEETESASPSFVLELYPSEGQRGVAGRFIAESREKRRSGAGVLQEDDQWMLESSSIPGGMSLPRLRWARKQSESEIKSAAHLAIAFDTFESTVLAEAPDEREARRPYFVYGLMSFFERQYTSIPSPLWRSVAVSSCDGEKHPADRTHTERLTRMQQVLGNAVVRNLDADRGRPVLQTVISPEKAEGLKELHRLCDWVITLDRNAGIEYFDSPRDNRDIYDSYVIDCVPEREDLGCLQLITSTSNLDEIRNLVDESLGRMGLSRSRRNAMFLQEQLKALSGRLAIRLTGQKAPTAELIALAMCQSNCWQAEHDDTCWTSLRTGFFVPVDDIQDLLPPAADPREHDKALEARAEAPTGARASRPDLIHVSYLPRRGLLFRFCEVKYRRHLRTARSPDAIDGMRRQVESLRGRWDAWYGTQEECPSFRSIRRAKLARVLRFYADKARRHADDATGAGLSASAYDSLIAEIDKLIEKGSDYSFAVAEGQDRGWMFCPEYAGAIPLEITPPGWEIRLFLFGPATDFRHDMGSHVVPTNGSVQTPASIGEPSTKEPCIDQGAAPPPADRRSVVGNASATVTDGDEANLPSSEKDESNPNICLGTSLLSGDKVRWHLTVRGNPHLLVAGLPGMGKTTCLLNLCQQMLKSGIRPIVFSYHQDIDEKLQQLVGAVRFVDFDGLGFNPLQVIDRNTPTAYLDVAGAIRDIFVAIFPELGDIQGERIRKSIKDSFIECGWDHSSSQPTVVNEPPFSRFLEILRSDPKPDRGLKTLLSRLEELEDYGFFRSTDVLESLWDSPQPVVLRIHSSQNDNLQKAFASLVFYSLYKDMFRRGIQSRITHALVFDEAHRAARLQLIPTMAKECRKYGISLVLASQEARDFNVSIFSAIANYLILRLTEVDAKVLARNVAASDQERTLIDRIKQMERFRAYYCTEGLRRPVPIELQP